jgi:hypothetical protein
VRHDHRDAFNNDRDQACVRAAMPEGARGFLDAIPALRNRECIVCGEGVAIPIRVRFDDLEPEKRPASSDPSFARLWRETGDDEVAAGELGAAGEGLAERIDRDAVAMDLEMKVRAGGEAGRADLADHLAAMHALAHPGQDPAHMAVIGLGAAAMVDRDHVAVPPVPAGELDPAVGDGDDLGAVAGAQVDALVHPGIIEDRMEAHAEAGGDPARHRPRHPAGLAADARGLEPLAAAVALPLHQLQRPAVGAGQARIEQFAGLDLAGRGAAVGEDDVEAVARADPAGDVELGGERAEIGLDRGRRHAGGACRAVEAVPDQALDAQRACRRPRSGSGAGRAGAGPLQLDAQVEAGAEGELLERTRDGSVRAAAEPDVHQGAGANLPDRHHAADQAGGLGGLGLGDARPFEQGGEAVVASSGRPTPARPTCDRADVRPLVGHDRLPAAAARARGLRPRRRDEGREAGRADHRRGEDRPADARYFLCTAESCRCRDDATTTVAISPSPRSTRRSSAPIPSAAMSSPTGCCAPAAARRR